jgi:hypothetical protein
MGVIPKAVTVNRIHPVHQKLNVILPWAVSARMIRREGFYLGYHFYTYGSELAAGIVGLGLSFPLLPVLANSAAQADLTKALAAGGFPTWLKVVAVGAAIAWVSLRVVASHNQWEKRATLARSCMQSFKKFEVDIERALDSADPMPALLEINVNMNAVVDRAIQEEAWPYPGLGPGAEAKGSQRASELAAKYGDQWTNLTTRERRLRGPANE